MQPLFNALYVMMLNAYAHPEKANIRFDASCDFGGYALYYRRSMRRNSNPVVAK